MILSVKPTLRQRIGVLICERRRACGLSRTELADLIDHSRNTIANWERGRLSPGVDDLYALAAVMGVAVEAFLPGVDARKVPG